MNEMQKKKIIIAQGTEISIVVHQKEDYISLTDIARYKNELEPNVVVSNWLRLHNTIEFLGVWERLYNPDFKPIEFEGFMHQAGSNSFTLSPKRWIETTNAIGIISRSGNAGGTFAHSDIAMEFASWISAEFKLYLVKEFQRLKETEQHQLQWTARRELTKLNYHLQTDAIKENLIAPTLTDRQKSFIYADEADVLNVALFGHTASEWRKVNPEHAKTGNVRDFANIHQLLVLANMESYNATMIKDGLKQSERIQKLNDMARYQLPILIQSNNNLLK